MINLTRVPRAKRMKKTSKAVISKVFITQILKQCLVNGSFFFFVESSLKSDGPLHSSDVYSNLPKIQGIGCLIYNYLHPEGRFWLIESV